MAQTGTNGPGDDQTAQGLPVDQLKQAGREFAQALMVRTLEKATGKIEGLSQRLDDASEGKKVGEKAAAAGVKALAKGESPIKAGLGAGVAGAKEKVKSAVGAGGGGGGNGGGAGKMKVTNIVEQFDVGVPRRVAYDQWTQFADFPSFTKKVESVEQESDEKLNWRVQVFLSRRTWESTITEQVPDERIVWRSQGPQGYVDGSVTFHELAPNLTRVLLVAEYHPGGFVEKTANLWRAQGRRLRLDFKHIKRHMMTQTLLKQEEVQGWRGEIRDGEVVKTHEEALKEEQGAEEPEDTEQGAEEPEDKEQGEKEQGAEEPEDKEQGEKEQGDKEQGDKEQGDKEQGDKEQEDKEQEDKGDEGRRDAESEGEEKAEEQPKRDDA